MIQEYVYSREKENVLVFFILSVDVSEDTEGRSGAPDRRLLLTVVMGCCLKFSAHFWFKRTQKRCPML